MYMLKVPFSFCRFAFPSPTPFEDEPPLWDYLIGLSVVRDMLLFYT